MNNRLCGADRAEVIDLNNGSPHIAKIRYHSHLDKGMTKALFYSRWILTTRTWATERSRLQNPLGVAIIEK